MQWGTFVAFGRKQGRGKNPLVNADWLRRKTNNGLLLATIQLSIVIRELLHAYSSALSAAEYHFTPRVTLDFEHGHLSRAINVS
jgi:hypothetical protein